jgi:Tol biopolymer transport system component
MQHLIPDDGGQFCFVDEVYDCDNRCIIMVQEDHKKSAPADVVNQVVAVDVNGSETTMQVLATGNDFYAAPHLSPDGTKMAYITWNHPNMPWDETKR